jgi:RNA polymerase sigma-70 factor
MPPYDEPEAWIDRVADAGAAQWPTLGLTREVLANAHARWPSVLARAVVDPAELFLVLACIDGRAAAMRAFEQRYLAAAQRSVARRGLAADELAEVGQRVRIRLFVHQRDGAPVVLHYAGSGRLEGVVRVTMVREALRYRATPASAELDLAVIGCDDPERSVCAAERHDLAKSAFERAAAALGDRDRSLLRLHYARGTSGSRIAVMYGVNRATAARWLESARLRLLAAFFRELRAIAPRLCTQQRERFDAWFDTHVELSLSRVLGTHG